MGVVLVLTLSFFTYSVFASRKTVCMVGKKTAYAHFTEVQNTYQNGLREWAILEDGRAGNTQSRIYAAELADVLQGLHYENKKLPPQECYETTQEFLSMFLTYTAHIFVNIGRGEGVSALEVTGIETFQLTFEVLVQGLDPDLEDSSLTD